jgi:hypothetical protein
MVTEKQNRILLQELIDAKVKKTTLDLAKLEATRIDGILVEFFQET